MIYDRHEDIAATTKRHPAIVRHRTGVTKDGVLVAQDIEVVMDGGAYCTLTPVVLSRGALHAGGPYRCPNVRIRARATRTNTRPTARSAASARRRPSSRPRRRSTGSPSARDLAARHPAAERLPPGRHDADRPGPARERRRRGGPRARGRGRRVRAHAGPDRRRAARRAGSGTIPAPLRTERDRTAPGIGLALAWHGAGFTGSGEVKLASVASLELTAEGRVRILTASTEMGQGTKTIFPQLVADALGLDEDDVEIAPQDTAYVPDSGRPSRRARRWSSADC